MKLNTLHGVAGRDPHPFVTLIVLVGTWVILIGMWEGAVRANMISSFITPSPSETAEQLYLLATKGLNRGLSGHISLNTLVGLTVYRVVPWVILGAFCGYFTAVWMALFPPVRYFALSFVAILYSVSALAVFLMLQNWMGFTEDPKYGLSLWVGFSIQVIMVYAYLYSLLYDPDKVDAYLNGVLETLTLTGVSRFEFIRRHSWPLLHRQAWIALTVAIVLAFKLVVLTDSSAGIPEGIGTLISDGYEIEDGGPALVFAGTFLLTACVMVSWALIAMLKRITRPWGT